MSVYTESKKEILNSDQEQVTRLALYDLGDTALPKAILFLQSVAVGLNNPRIVSIYNKNLKRNEIGVSGTRKKE